ncbi:N-acetyl-alpha-D-glucosaminyl L-malate synthase BshA [Christiangramia crocea]|uniref:N-acetyl-alpha-D-glucosaminyl L-malate synthase BshA n=1 Tax=Christiangramia crocea TaxID=2904124 RepID=A0A9X1UXW1_9FLAO|nr:N-acetyl-alpha-D-glucosaminyl L-malate synthase BshA [Gramella crocea]MCG9972324.1 N-acetyl-alpha-D-glucosaminyl L-malate synthase BshA [Gramella crocea]
MKIAIVCYPTFGGSGVVATELGLALSRRGHEVHFVTYKQPVRLETISSHIRFHEVNVPEYPLFHYQPYELALSSKLVNVVKNYGIELLHVHYAIPHAYAGYMTKKMLAEEQISLPMVTTLHGTDITLVGNHPFYKPAVTFSINHSDFVTSVSESLKEDTLKFFEVTKNIEVIPNFIDVAKFQHQSFTDCQRELMADEDEKIITHISNFRKVKRVDDVVNIFFEIQKKMKARLMMVGEGPQREVAENLVRELNIRDRVLFLGQSNEIDKILCFSDLFLLPSETESFGLAALEAMVHSVPVISSNTGGLPEVNIDGFSGFLHEVGDVQGMANSAISILEDPKRLEKFKKQALQAAEKYDINQIVPMYEDLYQRALVNA